jgi:hypothetical protein
VRLRSSARDQVHAVLAKYGIPVPCSDLSGAFGLAWLDGLDLPQPYAGKVTSLRQLTGWLTSEVGMLEEVTADFLGDWPPYRAVPALPGIGPVLGRSRSPRSATSPGSPAPATCAAGRG